MMIRHALSILYSMEVNMVVSVRGAGNFENIFKRQSGSFAKCPALVLALLDLRE